MQDLEQLKRYDNEKRLMQMVRDYKKSLGRQQPEQLELFTF